MVNDVYERQKGDQAFWQIKLYSRDSTLKKKSVCMKERWKSLF